MSDPGYVWRHTLECGHMALWGPFDDEENRGYIGEITVCELCPLSGRFMSVRYIVDVQNVPFRDYREPRPDLIRSRMDQLVALRQAGQEAGT